MQQEDEKLRSDESVMTERFDVIETDPGSSEGNPDPSSLIDQQQHQVASLQDADYRQTEVHQEVVSAGSFSRHAAEIDVAGIAFLSACELDRTILDVFIS